MNKNMVKRMLVFGLGLMLFGNSNLVISNVSANENVTMSEGKWVTGVMQRFKFGTVPPRTMFYGSNAPGQYGGYLNFYTSKEENGYIYCYYEGYIYKGGHYAPSKKVDKLLSFDKLMK